MQNSILKSFETFISTPLSVLRNKIINIVNLKSDFLTTKNVEVDILEEAIQVNVVNSEKVYNLLTTVMYKRRLYQQKELREKLGY